MFINDNTYANPISLLRKKP